MQQNLLVEPVQTYDARHAFALEDVFAYTDADPHIFSQLRNGPIRLMTLLNITAKLMPHGSKRQKLAIKHEILKRIGTLIRRGQLRRIRRVFVAIGGSQLFNQDDAHSIAFSKGSTPKLNNKLQ